jgi:plastocyanin
MTQNPRRLLHAVRLAGPVMLVVGVLAVSAWGVSPSDASSSSAPPPVYTAPLAPGVERLHLETGPFSIEPGQNPIFNAGLIQKPPVDGYVVGIKPNIRLPDGTVPPVDVIHLHHGVWFNDSHLDADGKPSIQPFLAVGEEKTDLQIPAGYGFPFKTTDLWTINYMIHDLTPDPAQIWVTYEIDFIPATSPAAVGITPVRPIYMDVAPRTTTFDVLEGSGTNGTFTYPDQAKDPYHGQGALNTWKVDRDSVIVATLGHLHPGGLHDDLWLDRKKPKSPAKTAHLFRSQAHYYEPAGAVSWDVSMTATRPDYRVQIHKGDVLRINSTYDTTKASWYQSMGIVYVWLADGHGGKDPFTSTVDQPGYLTHGHLAENSHHGGKVVTLADATTFKPVSQSSSVHINDFYYAVGDISSSQKTIPSVKAGHTIRFVNDDAPRLNGIWHTITACKAPCNKETGVAYPLANGKINFDSGELGRGGWPTSNRITWKTPKNLPPGTYTYFCRIHPFMRGAFSVTPAS